MSLHKDESGQALVLTTICMTVLMGFLGLAIDVGLLFRARQNVQIAADAAATAASIDYLYNHSATSAVTAGQTASSLNGFSDNKGGVSVTINLPPKSGPTAGDKNFAEAIVKAPSTTSMMALFGFRTLTVGARAVAGIPEAGQACIWLMAPSGTALSVQGSYGIKIKNCGIYVNSPDSDAVTVTGNGGTISANFVDVVGNVTPQHQTSPTPITSNTAARKNPFGDLSGPSVPSGCSITSSLTSVTTSNVSTVSGSSSSPVVCFTNAVTLGDGVNLPGAGTGVVYLFENGVTIGTGSTVTFGSGSYNSSTGTFSDTSGAVMELYGGTLTQDSSSILNIYGPTAGSYNGIAVLQPTGNKTQLQMQFGSNNEVIDGYIYAPAAPVFLQDSGGGVTASGVVAYSLSNQTSSFTIPSYDQANANTTPNRIITLVE